FDPEQFTKLARHPRVKMIEIKLSQGAKPGHGGVLPAAKVSKEIAEIRGIPEAQDCVSPAAHSAFGTPVELLQFIERLRQLSDGKPVGFKFCVGHPQEVLAICKAMVETKILPDFIVVDGKEGGTGAAPVEFSNHVGTPLREGLLLVNNALTAVGVRDQIRLGASGKIISAFDMAITMAIGADWCNAARGFMFSLGCLQSQHCHLGNCPVGIATQDAARQRGLVVDNKAKRVHSFHAATVSALSELVAAVGLDHSSELRPDHFYQRQSPRVALPLDEVYEFSQPGELLGPNPQGQFAAAWGRVRTDRFTTAPN
ncbi:MAG: FMN-binding glutamate synthase family protein, partial [Gammaproteobacteria bacterium]|nr:FMN-binding glutamate synthase family protein [Gammaproteobacteria bacterium]